MLMGSRKRDEGEREERGGREGGREREREESEESAENSVAAN